MFGLSLENGATLNAYKHRWTRRYFHHLADDGRAFLYAGDERYHEIDRRTAIELVFNGWSDLSDS